MSVGGSDWAFLCFKMVKSQEYKYTVLQDISCSLGRQNYLPLAISFMQRMWFKMEQWKMIPFSLFASYLYREVRNDAFWIIKIHLNCLCGR